MDSRKTALIVVVLVLSSGCLSGGITGRITQFRGSKQPKERDCRLWNGVASLNLSKGVLFTEWWGEVDGDAFCGVILSNVSMKGRIVDGLFSGAFSGSEPNTGTVFSGSFGGIISNESVGGTLYGEARMLNEEPVFFTGTIEGSCR